MELYQLKTFTMVAEEGHLTRAAKRINASQPAVSAHIKALEDELGINLFIRTPRGMVLTVDGIQLKQYADKALAVIDEMKGHASLLRETIAGDLRVGMNTDPESLRISELYSILQSQHPHLQLHLLMSSTGQARTRLEAAELDAAFIYERPTGDKLYAIELQRYKLVVAGPSLWREKIENVPPKELENLPWIMTPEDCPFHSLISTLFKKHDLSPKEVARVDQESAIRAMIKTGVGLSLMFERDVVVGPDKDEFAIWNDEKFNLTLSIACLKRRKDEARLQALFSTLSRVWEPDFI